VEDQIYAKIPSSFVPHVAEKPITRFLIGTKDAELIEDEDMSTVADSG
jgi:hypothetical protein